MRLGLIADVHANLPALDAVLAALAREEVDAIVCAGDLVGYGPHPNECVERIVERSIPTVAGNHDLMAVGRLSTDRCVEEAAASQRRTRRALSSDARTFLERLPRRLEIGSAVIAHGSLEDPEEYVVTSRRASGQLALLERLHPGHDLLVLGHSHRQRHDVARRTEAEGPSPVRRLVNPGSVGQSRQWERRPRARAAVVTEDRTVRWLAVPYDHAEVISDLAKIGGARSSVHAPPGPRQWYWSARGRFWDVVRERRRHRSGSDH